MNTHDPFCRCGYRQSAHERSVKVHPHGGRDTITYICPTAREHDEERERRMNIRTTERNRGLRTPGDFNEPWLPMEYTASISFNAITWRDAFGLDAA